MKNGRKWEETLPPDGVNGHPWMKRRRPESVQSVSPVHEAAVLEVVTVASDLQLPAGEAFPLIEGDLQKNMSFMRPRPPHAEPPRQDANI